MGLFSGGLLKLGGRIAKKAVSNIRNKDKNIFGLTKRSVLRSRATAKPVRAKRNIFTKGIARAKQDLSNASRNILDDIGKTTGGSFKFGTQNLIWVIGGLVIVAGTIIAIVLGGRKRK